MISLAGKAALVTGGNRGIGRAVALMLARAGADVGLTYRTRQSDADAVADEIRSLGRRAFVGGGDLADEAVADRVVDACHGGLGRLDVFVGNHGVWPAEAVPLRDMGVDRWRRTMAADLDSIFTSTRAALRRMTRGSIVLVSSTAGQRGEAFHADYAATKGAVIAMIRAIATEHARHGIRANAILPGWIETAMTDQLFAWEPMQKKVLPRIPVRRWGTPADFGGIAIYLASDASRYHTGDTLLIDGGYSIF
jgi:NAD(P)-dependent dehydrogenase (short-subunit alcohol dehydrogenase family)